MAAGARATVNSVWHAAHTVGEVVPTGSTAVPTAILATVTDPVITQIEIIDGLVYISLDGTPASASSYDFILNPITAGGVRHAFVSDPELMRIFSPAGVARWKVGFEAGLIADYAAFRPVAKVFSAAPGTSSGLDLGLVTNSPDVFRTVIQVKGAGVLYVTLDGRAASASDFDYSLTDPSGEEPADASYFDVAPSKIRIFATGGITYKLGYEQFPANEAGHWSDNPLYAYRGWV